MEEEEAPKTEKEIASQMRKMIVDEIEIVDDIENEKKIVIVNDAHDLLYVHVGYHDCWVNDADAKNDNYFLDDNSRIFENNDMDKEAEKTATCSCSKT